MVYLIMATGVALLGFVFARNASPGTLAAFNQFGVAAGILSRVLTVADAVRVAAGWFSDGQVGTPPLNVPAPVATKAGTQQSVARVPDAYFQGGASM